MRGNARTRAVSIGKEISVYFAKSGLTIGYIASQTLQTEKSISKIFYEGALPINYQLFVKVCELIGVPKKTLDKWAAEDLSYIFTYWDYVRPEAPSSAYFGKFLETKYEEKGFSRQDIIAATGKTPGGLSLIFNNKSKLTWPMLLIICNVSNLEPSQFLKEYEQSSLQSSTFEFSGYLEDARKRNGLSIKEISEKLMMSPKRYEKIEAGTITVYESELSRISTLLGVPLKTLIRYATKAAIFGENKSQTVKQKKLGDLCGILSTYKYIDTDADKVEGHTLVVLIFMILHNENDKFRPDILYYLNNLFAPGNLALQIHSPSKEDELTEVKVLDLMREKQGYTYESLSKVTEVSASALYEFLIGNTGSYFRTLFSLCDVLGASITLAFEAVVGRENPKRDTAELIDVYATIDTSRFWVYNDQTYKSEQIIKLFKIIFSKDSPINKYQKIKKTLKT